MSTANQRTVPYLPQLLLGGKCPLCGSVDFTVDVRQPLDVVMRLFALHPVRCVNCWRRYYHFSPKPKALR